MTEMALFYPNNRQAKHEIKTIFNRQKIMNNYSPTTILYTYV